jgi:hypothetical protein
MWSDRDQKTGSAQIAPHKAPHAMRRNAGLASKVPQRARLLFHRLAAPLIDDNNDRACLRVTRFIDWHWIISNCWPGES